MTNNTPDYEDNLYFDCKNCKMTDEYCASGECNKIQANNLACNKISLTEQWEKGELPEGWYYVKGSRAEGIYAYTAEYLNNMYRPQNSDRIIEQVPSYEEWKEKIEENAQLKELLKECRYEINPSYIEVIGGTKTFKNLIDKINEALR